MTDKMPEVVDLKGALEEQGSSLRITISHGFRIEIKDSTTDILGHEQADVYLVHSVNYSAVHHVGDPKRRAARPTFLGRFVTEPNQTVGDLLRQLADIYDAGKLDVQRR